MSASVEFYGDADEGLLFRIGSEAIPEGMLKEGMLISVKSRAYRVRTLVLTVLDHVFVVADCERVAIPQVKCGQCNPPYVRSFLSEVQAEDFARKHNTANGHQVAWQGWSGVSMTIGGAGSWRS